jgi:ribosomal protein L3 glutamine methyltransferase
VHIDQPRRRAPDLPLKTLGDWLGHAESLYKKTGAALGQVAAHPHDEALYLLLRTLGLPLDSDPGVLDRILTAVDRRAVETVLERRLRDRVPAAYLTREAILGAETFYVDERVIIPRSYFVEIIPDLKGPGPFKSAQGKAAGRVEGPPVRHGSNALRLADVCTGSGCLAILLARQFPGALVDAIDLSDNALDVAAINVGNHGLRRRVRLFRSDVFDSVPPARYDIILSNPPYEPSARMGRLPPEFKREPRLALDGGPDGLAVIRKLLLQAPARLKPRGIVLVEVGGLRKAIDREFGALKPRWLPTADGSDCICEFRGLGTPVPTLQDRTARSRRTGSAGRGTACASRRAGAPGGRCGSTLRRRNPRNRRS